MPRKNKAIVGYGVKFSDESIDRAYKMYELSGLFATEKDAKNRIARYKKDGHVHKGEDVCIFKVVVEILS